MLYLGQDSPDLANHVVPYAAHKWRDLGDQLMDSDLLKIIKADHPQEL